MDDIKVAEPKQKISVDLEVDTSIKDLGINPYAKLIHLARAVDSWRIFPRVFISTYIYLLYKVVIWYMNLEGPTMEQSGLVSIVVGAGAAWFGLYTGSRAKSDKRDMTKAMMSTVMKTVSAGQKTVISPTEIRNITKQIVADAESGSIKRFESALNKTEKILDELDVDLKDFNSGLAKVLKETQEQKQQKILEVEKLRSENIVAEVKASKQGKEFAFETKIL